jgi:hypothetical protein
VSKLLIILKILLITPIQIFFLVLTASVIMILDKLSKTTAYFFPDQLAMAAGLFLLPML